MMRGILSLVIVFGASASCSKVWAEETRPRSFQHQPLESLIVPEVEDAERESLARELRAASVDEIEARNWETAARQLEVAYILSSNPEALIPLSRAYRELGFLRAASERLERALEQTADADVSELARAEMRVLRGRFGALTIVTDPTGAHISLDGEERGEAPIAEPIVLEPGEYEIQAHLEGYRDLTRRVQVEAGDSVEIALQLEGMAPADSDNRFLDITFWTLVGIAAASATALVVTAAVGGAENRELNEILYPTSADSESVERWVNASFWMAGATGASAAAALVIAIARTRANRASEGE
jgi:hypothetical protein